MKNRELYLNKIRGGLFGGAVGDALGYPVEFITYDSILRKYGKNGIQSYSLDFSKGLALISDDTQMSLFTANGILVHDTCRQLHGTQKTVCGYVYESYKDWLTTQMGRKQNKRPISWLLDIPDLYSGRAPGNTCISALLSGKCGSISEPINHSKGCGGIMRVAPAALFYDPAMGKSREEIDMDAAEIAAITHGHSLGYIPSAILAHIVSVGVYEGCSLGDTMEDAVKEAMQTAEKLFAEDEYMFQLRDLVERAVMLSKNNAADIDNIRALGEGWVAEETLAIAVYCSLRYSNDFSKGVIAAVNHSGDTDSTGAVTGNILGSWLGYDAIEEKWKKNLELGSIILELADDLCYGCQLDENGEFSDPVWKSKYVDGKYVKKSQ